MSPEAPVQSSLFCSQCGRTFANSDMVQIAGNWVCGDCKPAYLSRVMASGAATAVPLLRLACALHNGMATFEQAGVSTA